ncbi:hypothetical protein GQ457_02G039660 [Hibiscus cannabinus]
MATDDKKNGFSGKGGITGETDPVFVTGRRTGESNAGEGERLGRQEVITLFVENLHWKGLWFSFARHGEVANVYIARRRSRGGKRFGFVRMKGLETAERVMNRLHGFILYGSKLTVKRARNNVEWDRKRFSGSLPQKPGTTGIGVGVSLGHGERIKISGLRRLSDDIAEVPMGIEKPKKIAGHVEDEDLWRLRRCLVGVSDTICSVSSIHQRENQKLSSVDKVNGKDNYGLLVSKDSVEGKIAERGSDRGYLVDSDEDWVNRRKRKAKKYGSILDIHNQSISEFERRRRDKALKKMSWSKEQMEDTELSGKSLSDSDINYRVSMIVKEARQIVGLGKRIGVNFVGDENEVINDLVDIELKA